MRTSFKTLIIDDEPSARKILQVALKKHESVINVVGEASSLESAISSINKLKPELIFLDINLKGKSAFDILVSIETQPFIIFTTAYDEYALKAFENNSIDYILKPITTEKIDRAVDKLLQFTRHGGLSDIWSSLESVLHSLKKPRSALTTLSVKSAGKVILLDFSNILYLEATDKYTYVHTTGGQKFLSDHLLSVMGEKLPENFLRVQKSYIINLDKVKEIHRFSNSRFSIYLNDAGKTNIISGPFYYDKIKMMFNF